MTASRRTHKDHLLGRLRRACYRLQTGRDPKDARGVFLAGRGVIERKYPEGRG